MPVYILLPKGATGPLPTVVAFHGHGYGVKDIVGLWEDGGERDEPDGYHKDFGVALCRAGFAVAAPEISGFGERQTDFSHLERGQGAPSTCTHMAMLAFHLGSSVVGIRVRDGLRLVDYLETRPEFDTSRLGAMGISGGGMHTFFSTCMDERIRACVISGYYSTFEHSILAMSHCPCNYVPGLAEFGENVRSGRPHRPRADCWWRPAPTTPSSPLPPCAPAWPKHAEYMVFSQPASGWKPTFFRADTKSAVPAPTIFSERPSSEGSASRF